MTQIIAYNIYRTESINVAGVSYTIRFASTEDGQDHTLMVSNDINNKQCKYHFTSEAASDFRHLNNKDLADEVIKIIEDDLENERI